MNTIPIDIPKDAVSTFCRRNHIKRLSLFGSVLRDDFGMESDIDCLVEFDDEHVPGLIRLAGMEIELSEILGRKVDLRTPQDLSSYFREEVLSTAVVQYAES
jgi:predicted nucleotidyltransferase